MECHDTPLRSTVMGFNGMTISYEHYYFHQVRVLLTHAFATSTTATTVGDEGKPRWSTELGDESGHNCCMTNSEYRTFAHLVLGLDPTQNTIGTGNKGYSSMIAALLTCSLLIS
jgi:hypothetical protein